MENKGILSTMTFINIFDEECWGDLYELMRKAVERSCERHGLDPQGWESWAIGYTHPEACNGCGVATDEVVECSECGNYCVDCYEANDDNWVIRWSGNHCYNYCPMCR